MGDKKEEYNNEPVYYCKQCLSLRILGIPGIEDLDFCDDCGSTNIGTTDIHTWEDLYKQRFNINYLDKY